MIIINLTSGLGNQMFQYAIGRHLSLKYDVPLRFDTYFYDQNDHRTPTLFKHNIVGKRMTSQEFSDTVRYPMIGKWMREGKEFITTPTGGTKLNLYYIPRLFPEFAAANFNYYREKLEEDQLTTSEWAYRQQYHHKILNCGENAYLNGYWQSPKYFEAVSETIREDLTIAEPLPESNQKYASEIEQNTAVSIHIRRGDKAGNSDVVPVEYFEQAAEYVAQRTDNPSFFVFSDDIDWAKKNLELTHPCEFVSENGEKTDYLDIHLMKSCDHNIVANSTFSWWGAYLNDNKNKIITVPDPWFGLKWPNSTIHDTDLVPAEWTFIRYTE